MSYLKKVAKTSRPKHPRPNCPCPSRPMAKLSEHRFKQLSIKLYGNAIHYNYGT